MMRTLSGRYVIELLDNTATTIVYIQLEKIRHPVIFKSLQVMSYFIYRTHLIGTAAGSN